jgi:hypothetical protein
MIYEQYDSKPSSNELDSLRAGAIEVAGAAENKLNDGAADVVVVVGVKENVLVAGNSDVFPPPEIEIRSKLHRKLVCKY